MINSTFMVGQQAWAVLEFQSDTGELSCEVVKAWIEAESDVDGQHLVSLDKEECRTIDFNYTKTLVSMADLFETRFEAMEEAFRRQIEARQEDEC